MENNQTLPNIDTITEWLKNDAKVDAVQKLQGIPVEVTFDGNLLKEWRILTEVL